MPAHGGKHALYRMSRYPHWVGINSDLNFVDMARSKQYPCEQQWMTEELELVHWIHHPYKFGVCASELSGCHVSANRLRINHCQAAPYPWSTSCEFWNNQYIWISMSLVPCTLAPIHDPSTRQFWRVPHAQWSTRLQMSAVLLGLNWADQVSKYAKYGVAGQLTC